MAGSVQDVAAVYAFDGKLGLASNQSAHGADPRTFLIYRDLINDYAGRRRKRPGKGAAIGGAAGGVIYSEHEYVYTNPTTGAVSYIHFRGTTAKIQRQNGGAWVDQTLPAGMTLGGRWRFVNFANRCFAVNGVDLMIYCDGAALDSWFEVGIDAPITDLTYTLQQAYNGGFALVAAFTNGSNIVTGTGTAFDASTMVGRVLEINGINYIIQSVTDPTHLKLTQNFHEPTIVTTVWLIFNGVGDWVNPPRYAYAYFNPTTGHCSNRGPILEIVEENQVGTTIQINGIPYDPVAYANGYTEIKLFRTPANAASLLALTTTIANSNAPGTASFTETAGTFLDTALTDLEAPIFNAKPTVGVDNIAVFQGRVVGTSSRDNKFYFCRTSAESDFGVPSFSWPALNYRDVTAPRGLVPIGGGTSGALIILTEGAELTIRGYSNADYTIEPLPTRGRGGWQTGVAVFSGHPIILSRDRKIVDLSTDQDFGLAVQDKLDAMKTALLTDAVVFWFTAATRNYLLVSFASGSGSTTNDYTLVFDIDNGNAIYEWTIGFTAFASVHDPSTLALNLWGSDAAGNSYELFQSGTWQDAGANVTPSLRTVVLRTVSLQTELLAPATTERSFFPAYIKIWVNDASASWTGTVFYDEQPSGAAFAFSAVENEQQNAQGRELSFVFDSPQRTQALQFDVIYPTGNADYYIERMIVVSQLDTSAGAEE